MTVSPAWRSAAPAAPLAAAGKDYLACSAARRQGTCEQRQSLWRGDLEGLILAALQERLMAPERVAEFIRAFHAAINRQRHALELDAGVKRRQLEAVRRKLDG